VSTAGDLASEIFQPFGVDVADKQVRSAGSERPRDFPADAGRTAVTRRAES
jgi:hypothetical protein